MKINKKISVSTLFILSFLVAINFSKAYSIHNVSGWLWGGSDDGAGINSGLGWISANNTIGGGMTPYGMTIPEMDGNLSGYVWSENVGWISFNPSDISGCPDSNCISQRSGNNLIGWARIISIPQAGLNAGGWQGWIRLNPAFGGVSINTTDNKLSGYAWSDELGWIDFSKASIKSIQGTVSASPNVVDLATTPVSITANVTGGTAIGGITYELDCNNSGDFSDGRYPTSGTTTDTSHEYHDACTYSSPGGQASIRITRDGVSIAPSAAISFCSHSDACKTATCIGTKCSDSCGTEYDGTKDCRDSNWKEVSPN